jgi:hypothetical protein
MRSRFLRQKLTFSNRIGIDLDGTVVLYDRLFYRLAIERFGLPQWLPKQKTPIRDWLRQQPRGEQKWISLQGLAYGPKMHAAEEAPGLRNFLAFCRYRGWEVHLVSHKGAVSSCPEKYKLRQAALEWLERSGLIGPHAFFRQNIHFSPNRETKLLVIQRLNLRVFIDDLQEILLHPLFPSRVQRWHYVPNGSPSPLVDAHLQSWWQGSQFALRCFA